MFDEKFIEIVVERVLAAMAEMDKRNPATRSMEPRYLTFGEAGAMIGTTYEGIRGLVRKENLPVVHRGSKRHIDRYDLIAFMESRKVTGGNAVR